MHRYLLPLLITAAFCILFFPGCLVRDNPWDPVNRLTAIEDSLHNEDSLRIADSIHAADSLRVEDSLQMIDSLRLDSIRTADSLRAGSLNSAKSWLGHFMDSLLTIGDSLDAVIASEDSLLSFQNVQNSLLLSRNDSIQVQNNSKTATNSLIDTLSGASCYTLKSLLDPLTPFNSITAALNLSAGRMYLQALDQTGNTAADSLRSAFYPDTVIADSSLEAFGARFSGLEAGINNIQTRRDSALNAVSAANSTWSTYNLGVADSNVTITAFNTAVQSSTDYCYARLTSALALQQSMPNLRPGDSLFIDTGMFNVTLNIKLQGTADSGIVIVGHDSGTTILTSNTDPPVYIDGAKYIEFKNINFTSTGSASALKLVNDAGPIIFRNCDFSNARLDGIEVIDAQVSLINCRFLNNGRNGISIKGQANNYFTIMDNVLSARNGDYGIYSITIEGEINSATIAGNGLDGIYQDVPNKPLNIRSTIISHNNGYGIRREKLSTAKGAFSLTDCVIFSNSTGAIYSDPPYDTLDFMDFDPIYTDTANFNYTPDSGSAVPDSIGFRN